MNSPAKIFFILFLFAKALLSYSQISIADTASISGKRDSLVSSTKPTFTLPDSSQLKTSIKGTDLKKNLADTLKGTVKSTISDILPIQEAKAFKSTGPNDHIKKQLKNIQPKGTISAGYEYGILPFVSGNNYPSGGFKTEGKISFLALGLPLELTYYYTTIKNIIGLNNYFRLSYDADRYRDQLNKQLDLKSQLSRLEINKLQLEQQQLLGKMEYLRFLEKNPDYQAPDFNTQLNKSRLENPFQDSLNSYNNTYKIPSNPYQNPMDSLSKFKNDSLKSRYDYSKKKDSIKNELNAYRSKYDSINNQINTVKKQIDQIKNLQNDPGKIDNPYLSKVQQFLSNIKKFEIGLCHPSYSTFLVNNVPLQGINLEYSKNNNFLALTYGTTINTLMYNTNTLQGQIQGMKNLYNYFDFGNLSAGRKIFSAKGGIGSKDDSHLYIGFLLGKGRADYLNFNPNDKSKNYPKESNLVLELDAKYKLSEHFIIDVILGKSSVREENLSMAQINRSFDEIFSGYRSYAALTRINTGIKKTNTKLTFTTRWIDPFFKSFGIGFLRSDNLRYEIKAEQPITKKLKYTVALRREEDNLLKLYNYKNTLHSINNSLNIKFTREFNIRLIYAPLFRELKYNDSVMRDKNHITTAIATYMPRTKNVSIQFNGLYSRYLVSGDSGNINFENVTYTHQFLFKSGFKTDMNVSWYKSNLKDTIGNDTYLTVLDVGYTTKNKSSFVLGGKMAYRSNIDPQFGFLAKATVRVYKQLFWEAEIEKILIGDYYNSFMIEKIRSFPYYCSTKLILSF